MPEVVGLFLQRAINHGALLQKKLYKDKASNASLHPVLLVTKLLLLLGVLRREILRQDNLVAKYYAKTYIKREHYKWKTIKGETDFELQSYFHDLSYLGAKYGANGTHFLHTLLATSYSMPQFATP